jgi:hypothetical protein
MGQRAIPSWISRHSYHSAEQIVKNKKLDHRVYSKRSVLVVTKVCEIVAMGLGWLALLSGQSALMLVVLFLLALQATFFSPAKCCTQ